MISAAKRSTATILSRGKSEYSRAMSSYDMPSAKHVRMNDAEKRVPPDRGLAPPQAFAIRHEVSIPEDRCVFHGVLPLFRLTLSRSVDPIRDQTAAPEAPCSSGCPRSAS